MFLQNSSFFYNNLFVLVSQFLFFDCIQKRKEIYTNEIGNLWNWTSSKARFLPQILPEDWIKTFPLWIVGQYWWKWPKVCSQDFSKMTLMALTLFLLVVSSILLHGDCYCPSGCICDDARWHFLHSILINSN